MSSESYVGLGVVFLPAIVPLAVAAAGIAATGAVLYGGAKLAQSAYDAHKERIVERYGAETEHLAALDQAVSEIASARAALASRIRQQVIREREATVHATAFGELTLSAIEGVGADEAEATSAEANKAQMVSTGDAIDFSDMFAADIECEADASLTAEEWLESVRRRISGLVAFTSREKGRQERLLERCDRLEASSLSLQDVQHAISSQVEDMCAQLMEGDAELRRETYMNYIVLCDLEGVAPREMTFEAMSDAAFAMGEAYVERRIQASVLDSVNESLSRVGLENAGAVTFAGEEGFLVVDENDRMCGMFMRKSDDDDSFLFTTVSAEEPLRAGKSERGRILSSARRLCDKKRTLFDEVLPDIGIVADIGYEYDPPTLDCIHKMPQFAARVQKRSASDSAARESVCNENRQEM